MARCLLSSTSRQLQTKPSCVPGRPPRPGVCVVPLPSSPPGDGDEPVVADKDCVEGRGGAHQVIRHQPQLTGSSRTSPPGSGLRGCAAGFRSRLRTQGAADGARPAARSCRDADAPRAPTPRGDLRAQGPLSRAAPGPHSPTSRSATAKLRKKLRRECRLRSSAKAATTCVLPSSTATDAEKWPACSPVQPPTRPRPRPWGAHVARSAGLREVRGREAAGPETGACERMHWPSVSQGSRGESTAEGRAGRRRGGPGRLQAPRAGSPLRWREKEVWVLCYHSAVLESSEQIVIIFPKRNSFVLLPSEK